MSGNVPDEDDALSYFVARRGWSYLSMSNHTCKRNIM
jgi:hypothetical protein